MKILTIIFASSISLSKFIFQHRNETRYNSIETSNDMKDARNTNRKRIKLTTIISRVNNVLTYMYVYIVQWEKESS